MVPLGGVHAGGQIVPLGGVHTGGQVVRLRVRRLRAGGARVLAVGVFRRLRARRLRAFISISISISLYIYLSLSIYIYIYIERERERDYISISLSLYFLHARRLRAVGVPGAAPGAGQRQAPRAGLKYIFFVWGMIQRAFWFLNQLPGVSLRRRRHSPRDLEVSDA